MVTWPTAAARHHLRAPSHSAADQDQTLQQSQTDREWIMYVRITTASHCCNKCDGLTVKRHVLLTVFILIRKLFFSRTQRIRGFAIMRYINLLLTLTLKQRVLASHISGLHIYTIQLSKIHSDSRTKIRCSCEAKRMTQTRLSQEVRCCSCWYVYHKLVTIIISIISEMMPLYTTFQLRLWEMCHIITATHILTGFTPASGLFAYWSISK